MEEGLICIIYSVFSSGKIGGRGSFASSTVSPSSLGGDWREELFCIIHSVSSSIFGGDWGEGLICIIHSVSPSSLGVGERRVIWIRLRDTLCGGCK